jgi:restriction system protein
MKDYYRLMLGRKSAHAGEAFAGGFVGTDFGIHGDLSRRLPDEWRSFNKPFIAIVLANHSDKSKIGAGLACGALWTVSKGIGKGDAVLCPDGPGSYRVGEVLGDYYRAASQTLPQRRKVRCPDTAIPRAEMRQIAELAQSVEGAIIALDDDQKLPWAFASVPAMSLYRYQISFKLMKS